jgi:hypothetical protein
MVHSVILAAMQHSIKRLLFPNNFVHTKFRPADKAPRVWFTTFIFEGWPGCSKPVLLKNDHIWIKQLKKYIV